MRLTIILLLVSSVCFGQASGDELVMSKDSKKIGTKSIAVDSLNIPVFSTKEVMGYLIRINNKLTALRELELISAKDSEKIVLELNKIIAEMDKKRKGIK